MAALIVVMIISSAKSWALDKISRQTTISALGRAFGPVSPVTLAVLKMSSYENRRYEQSLVRRAAGGLAGGQKERCTDGRTLGWPSSVHRSFCGIGRSCWSCLEVVPRFKNASFAACFDEMRTAGKNPDQPLAYSYSFGYTSGREVCACARRHYGRVRVCSSSGDRSEQL